MKRKLLVILGLLVSVFVYGQNNYESTKKYDGKFIHIGAGLDVIKFKDLGTSPLFYTGILTDIELGLIKFDSGKEREFKFSFARGKAINTISKTTYTSNVMIGNLSYSKIYPVWHNERFMCKVGGEFKNTFQYRNNPSFQNNAVGIEFFSTLSASGKISWNISNRETKRFKILFIPFTLQPRKRELSFNMKLALMNNTYRNGYAYIGDSAVVNEASLFDGYEFKMFSGYRIGTELNYTVFLKNGNAIKLGYELDAYRTGGNLDKFQIANFKLKIALLFKTK